MNKKSGLVTHIFVRTGLTRFSWGDRPNPARGDLFIDPPAPYLSNPFCFSAARRRLVPRPSIRDCRRAAEKQKGGYSARIVSINRSPLTGFGRNKAAVNSLYKFNDAYNVKPRPAHSTFAAYLAACVVALLLNPL
jgi:hypothetical protein